MRHTYMSYDEWLSGESFREQFQSIGSNPLEATKLIASVLSEKEGFTESEKFCFEILKESDTSFEDWEDLNEGLLQKLKDVRKKMLDKGKEGFEKFKNQFDREVKGVPDFFRALASGIKRVCGYIKEHLKRVLRYMFSDNDSFVKRVVGQSTMVKMQERVKDSAKKEPVKLQVEAKGVRDIAKGVPNLITASRISKAIENAVEQADEKGISKDELALHEKAQTAVLLAFAEALKIHSREEISEGLKSINESEHSDHKHFNIPFITTLQQLIEKIPPFNWLAKLADMIGDNVNNALTSISKFMESKSVIDKATKFVVLGSIVGLGVEMVIKSQAKHALSVMFPVVNSTVSVLGCIATAIWTVHLISQAVEGLEEVVEEIDEIIDDVATDES